MVIRLGHFSVREYLVSEGIKDSKVSKFSIIDIVADLFIAKSWLQYILYYDGLDSKTSSLKDLKSSRSWNTYANFGTFTLQIFCQKTRN